MNDHKLRDIDATRKRRIKTYADKRNNAKISDILSSSDLSPSPGGIRNTLADWKRVSSSRTSTTSLSVKPILK